MHNNQRITELGKEMKNRVKKAYVNNKTKLKPLYEKSTRGTKDIYTKVVGKVKDILGGDHNNKRSIYIKVGVTGVILACILAVGVNNSQKAYEIQMDDKVLGIVRTEEQFLEAVEVMEKEVQALYGHEFALPEDIELLPTKAGKKKISKTEDLVNNIKKQLDMNVKVVALKVNGEEIGCVKDVETITSILDQIKLPYIDEECEYQAVEFVEKIDVEKTARSLQEVKTREEILKVLEKGTDEEATHRVEAGENTWTIAQLYDITMEDIDAANPGLEPERIQIGQEISLIVPKPYLTVQTKEYIELVENIPFETENKPTDSLYKGDKKITTQGIEGEREIKGYLIKENGIEIDREIIEEKILQEPVTRVIAEGTKERPATVATGTFARPTRGRLTSGFGARWGRRHEGIDIGASTGTHITAADAGKVSFAGNKGAYGKLVIINHENGYQTYYAHTSKIHVKQGDRVYKGQHIANVGSTGRSTGPHLHFEVRKNGTPINPSRFVKY